MVGTNWTAMDSFEDILIAGNDGGPFWTMILFMMWVVLMITFIPFGSSVAIIGGSFIAFIIGIFLAYMGLVSFKWVLALIGITIALVIWDILFGKKEG